MIGHMHWPCAISKSRGQLEAINRLHDIVAQFRNCAMIIANADWQSSNRAAQFTKCSDW